MRRSVRDRLDNRGDRVEFSMGYRIVVVGATGNVGREMLNILV